MPTRTQASKGSAPASPHTLTGLPARAPARAASAISDRGAGCHGSAYSARSADVRSAAIVYWVRSFVPMDTKSTASRNWSMRIATEGTSTMMPARRSTPYVSQRWRTIAENHCASGMVETMGAMTHTRVSGALIAAMAMASNWFASIEG